MGRYTCVLTAGICSLMLAAGCADPSRDLPGDDGRAAFMDGWPSDASPQCKDPAADWDNDGISNGDEGCLSGRDTDGDKTPDWQDLDADGDKIPDHIERGAKTPGGACAHAKGNKQWPCDTDGDKVPDYMDQDSDGDGPKNNALVFINTKFKKGSEVITSYKRWERQVVPQ